MVLALSVAVEASSATEGRSAGAVRAGEGTLLGVAESGARARLLRLRPGTLEQVGPPLRMRARFVWDFAISPDGHRLAVGSDQRSEIELFDLRRWRRLGVVRLPGPHPGGYGGATGLVWSTPRRLLALAGPPFTRASPVVVDPQARRVVHRSRWRGRPFDWKKAAGRLVFVSAPYGGTTPGHARIATFSAGGDLRERRLGRIEAGYWRERRGPARSYQPGLAITESGGRAFVVATDGRLVAEVDLRDLRVDYRELSDRASAAKGEPLESRWRHAELLENGALAVSGEDVPAVRPPQRPRSVVYGVRLIDPLTWTVRVVDGQAQDFTAAGETLLARRWAYRDGLAPIGLRGYDNIGRLRFSRFAGADTTVRGIAGGLAYVDVRRPGAKRRIHVLDLATSRTLRVLPWRKVRLLGPGEF